MINSLTELYEAKEKGQQFEYFGAADVTGDDNSRVWQSITMFMLSDLSREWFECAIAAKQLRVKQIKQ